MVSNENPKSKLGGGSVQTPSLRRDAPVTANQSGRVTHDDRGNAIWEWAISTGAFPADTPTARLKKLDNPTLSLVDEVPIPASLEMVKDNPLGAVRGYSPYDSGLLAKKDKPRPTKDLRKLGEWLAQRKHAVADKQDK